MKQSLRLDFKQNHIPREDFLKNTKESIFPFIENNSWTGHAFLMLVMEIIKNIYDHANSTGHAYFEKDDKTISFEIVSHDTKNYPIKEQKKKGVSKKESGVNFGIGLQIIIPKMAETLRMEAARL